jgi:hypothetical protein
VNAPYRRLSGKEGTLFSVQPLLCTPPRPLVKRIARRAKAHRKNALFSQWSTGPVGGGRAGIQLLVKMLGGSSSPLGQEPLWTAS